MGKSAFGEWQTIFQNMATELLRLNTSTEDDFISMGEHLEGLYVQTKEISGMATQTAGLMQSNEIEGNVEELQKIIYHVKEHLEDSEKGLDETCRILQIICEHLSVMGKSFAGFKSIVKRLKVLGISTKIESARLFEGNNGFLTLAHDVEELSEAIAAKSAHILEKLIALQDVIQGMLSKVLMEVTRERGSVKNIIERILSNLSSLQEKKRSSSDTVTHIEGCSVEMERKVSEIVASLQFHDITRQQIDHVKEVIDEWCGRLSALSDNNHVDGDISMLPDVCDLEARQLSNSKDELITAVKSAMEGLNKIAQKVRYISQEIYGLMNITDKHNGTFFSEMKESVSSIIGSLRETAKAVESLSTGIQSVAGTLNKLTVFIDEIEKIGMEIELIALNARIKAAHTGIEGAALGILAEEVKNVSVQGQHQTTLISRGLQEIGSLSVDLLTGTNYTKDTAIHETEELVLEMSLLVDSFEKANARVIPMITLMEKKTNTLAEAVDQIVEGIFVHKKADKELHRCVVILNDVAKDAREWFPGLKTKEQMVYLKELEGRYTMRKELDIHRGLSVSAKESHYGDNVELF
jgi:hypothetical protein